MKKFEILFSPIRVGLLTLKNRISYSPTDTEFAGASGEVNRLFLDFYSRVARGGAAMVFIGSCSVKFPEGRNTECTLRIDEDRFIPGLNKLAEAIRMNGAVAVAQLTHGGRFSHVEEPVGPSEIPGMSIEGHMTKKIRALSTSEVEEMVELYAQAALRAKKAGFDMVDVDLGTGYLLTSFYSPRTNKRLDKYGGSFENRIRFPLEVIGRIQELCGPDYPLASTMIVDELMPDGFQLEDGKALARVLEKAGIACLVGRAATYESMHLGEGVMAMRTPWGHMLPYTEAIKKEVNIPMLSFAKIGHPNLMEKALQEGKCDIIHAARPLIADPDLPRKAQEGRIDDIRFCISCNMCHERMSTPRYVGCAINAEMGLEDWECRLEKTNKPKKVVIVGGGPAGLEAARVAALKGHKVTLYEKEKEPGGQLLLAAKTLGGGAYKSHVIDWLVRQCKKAGVEINLNKEVTPLTIEELKPDVVIIATGATFLKPPIPGVNRKNVYSFTDVLNKKIKFSGKKVVVIGGGLIGAAIADLVAEKEKDSQVTIIDKTPEIAGEWGFFDRFYLMNKFEEYNVEMRPNLNAEEITEDGVVVCDKKWNKELIKADAVVIGLGGKPERKLAEASEGKVPELYTIGDCFKPRRLYDAIHDGFHVARNLI